METNPQVNSVIWKGKNSGEVESFSVVEREKRNDKNRQKGASCYWRISIVRKTGGRSGPGSRLYQLHRENLELKKHSDSRLGPFSLSTLPGRSGDCFCIRVLLLGPLGFWVNRGELLPSPSSPPVIAGITGDRPLYQFGNLPECSCLSPSHPLSLSVRSA